MKQIISAYSLHRETVAPIMILYKNTKVKAHSPDRDADFFNIVVDMLQGVTLAPYQLIICPDKMLRTSIDLMKENGFTLAKAKSRR